MACSSTSIWGVVQVAIIHPIGTIKQKSVRTDRDAKLSDLPERLSHRHAEFRR